MHGIQLITNFKCNYLLNLSYYQHYWWWYSFSFGSIFLKKHFLYLRIQLSLSFFATCGSRVLTISGNKECSACITSSLEPATREKTIKFSTYIHCRYSSLSVINMDRGIQLKLKMCLSSLVISLTKWEFSLSRRRIFSRDLLFVF